MMMSSYDFSLEALQVSSVAGVSRVVRPVSVRNVVAQESGLQGVSNVVGESRVERPASVRNVVAQKFGQESSVAGEFHVLEPSSVRNVVAQDFVPRCDEGQSLAPVASVAGQEVKEVFDPPPPYQEVDPGPLRPEMMFASRRHVQSVLPNVQSIIKQAFESFQFHELFSESWAENVTLFRLVSDRVAAAVADVVLAEVFIKEAISVYDVDRVSLHSILASKRLRDNIALVALENVNEYFIAWLLSVWKVRQKMERCPCSLCVALEQAVQNCFQSWRFTGRSDILRLVWKICQIGQKKLHCSGNSLVLWSYCNDSVVSQSMYSVFSYAQRVKGLAVEGATPATDVVYRSSLVSIGMEIKRCVSGVEDSFLTKEAMSLDQVIVPSGRPSLIGQTWRLTELPQDVRDILFKLDELFGDGSVNKSVQQGDLFFYQEVVSVWQFGGSGGCC